ncbi:MAG: flagellar hook-basal body protein [Francisellaceae bacterium]
MLDAITSTQIAMNRLQDKLAIEADNAANINTAGYRASIGISQPFDQLIDAGDLDNANDSKPIKVMHDFSHGKSIYTAKPLDVMISGDGFFVVQKDHHTYVTRLGHFNLNKNGALQLPNGAIAEGLDGSIAPDSKVINIDGDGVIWVDGKKSGKFEIVRFDDLSQLIDKGQGLYQAKYPGKPADDKTTVIQGFVEGSNVNNVAMMSDMMAISSDFQSSQKVLKAYDDMLNTAINQMGD